MSLGGVQFWHYFLFSIEAGSILISFKALTKKGSAKLLW